MSLQNTEDLKKQYGDGSNLKKRISIHEKYSTNKIGFGNWLISQYDIFPDTQILELGCGTGDIWINHLDKIENAKLVLSDFSKGMLENAKANLGNSNNTVFKVIDIQDIPFDDESFDVVIANMMLYHVPDLNKGLLEVKRILKDGGKFYCSTFGENGIVEYIESLLGIKEGKHNVFTLQNGAAQLSSYFSNIERLDYEDSLAVTATEDIINYISSLSDMTKLNNIEHGIIKEVLESKKNNGILSIPKEYGMFICKK